MSNYHQIRSGSWVGIQSKLF